MIKLLVMDVDGTLTDGKIYMGENGELIKAFCIKDGMGISIAKKSGIIPCIITGRTSKIVEMRCKELGIDFLFQGANDKIRVLKDIIQTLNITHKDVAYIGDDINDLECIKYVGVSACPKNAVSSVLKEVDYISNYSGGEGAVRDFIEYLISLNQ